MPVEPRIVPPRRRDLPPFVDHETEELIDLGPVPKETRKAVSRARSGASGTRQKGRTGSASRRDRRPDKAKVPTDLLGRLAASVGPKRAERLAARLAEAGEDFLDEHFDDAARLASGVVKEAPDIAEARELLGLTRYRQARWRPAIRELEAYVQLTGAVDQNAVLADCYRAVGQHSRVIELWEELRAVSPGPELVTEGRIVAAGSLADQGMVTEAIALLAKGWRWPQRPAMHHLRRAYALADLYERAGDLPAARELFARVASIEPDLGDAAARAAALD